MCKGKKRDIAKLILIHFVCFGERAIEGARSGWLVWCYVRARALVDDGNVNGANYSHQYRDDVIR